jgi:phage shock protein A
MKMREMHNKLENDIAELKNRQSMLKAKMAVAETKQKMNKMSSGIDSAGNNLASFDRMEEKVNRMLDEADAMEELNSGSSVDDVSALEKKYDAQDGDSSIDDELAALKAEMGM